MLHSLQPTFSLPLQTFVPLLAVDVGFRDFASAQKSLGEALIWMQARLEEPFALTQPPLFRCDLLKLADGVPVCPRSSIG